MAKQNLPPAHIKPVDLVAEFMARPRPHRKVESPLLDNSGKKIEIVMWVLTAAEAQLCSINAEKFTRKLLKEQEMEIPKYDEKSEGYKTVYDGRAAIEILSIACRNPSDIVNTPLFLTPEIMGKKLTTDQIAVLFNEYLILKEELGPVVGQGMSQHEMDEWMKVIQEGGVVNFLASTTLGAQSQFLKYLVNQLLNSQTDNSSSILPLKNGSKIEKTNDLPSNGLDK